MNALTNEFLRRKLSPQADPQIVEALRAALASTNLRSFERYYRGQQSIVLKPSDAWKILHPEKPGNRWSSRFMSRALLALFWERSVTNGEVVFHKTLDEYQLFGY